MKKALRIVALIMAISLAFTCFTACSSNEKDETTKDGDNSFNDRVENNANAKTCSSNMKSVKACAANYFACYNEAAKSLADLAAMYDDGRLPTCPVDNREYDIVLNDDGSAIVTCPNGHTTN